MCPGDLGVSLDFIVSYSLNSEQLQKPIKCRGEEEETC